MAQRKGSKDMQPQAKSPRTARGLASPGGSGTPPAERHQAAGEREPDQRRPRPGSNSGR
jgi:hypothetical protein